MGKPGEITVVVGNYSDTGLKGKESSITTKIRMLFKRKKYKTLLIDEFRTSCICSNCEKRMVNYNVQKEGYEPIWKLMHCEKCNSIHNRDRNATKNMLKIIENIRETGNRPLIFRR
jgi:transposase